MCSPVPPCPTAGVCLPSNGVSNLIFEL
jgi:hypothetical protein